MFTTTPTPESRDEAFEAMLRRELGPGSVQRPPADLRKSIAMKVAELQLAAPMPVRQQLLWPSLLAASFLGLVGAWLLMWWLKAGGPMLDTFKSSLASAASSGDNWLDLLRSPLALALLPLILLPILAIFSDAQMDA